MIDETDTSNDSVSTKDDKFASDVSNLVSSATLYRDSLSSDRIRAMQYFNGEMTDIEPRKGWSQVVSMDVRATMKKLLPSLMRTMLGNEIVAEFSGQNEDDVEGAEQATDYINLVVFPESEGEKAVHDAMHDACLLRNGILFVGVEEKTVVTGSSHTGLDEVSISDLVNDDAVEVLESRQYPDPEQQIDQTAMDQSGPQDPMHQPMPPMPPEPSMLYDIKIKRTVHKSKVLLQSVPPEEYLIHPDAVDSQNDAPLVGREGRKSRSDLIAMGYDYDMVMALPAVSYNATSDGEKFSRRQDSWMQNTVDQKELEQVLYYDLYVRLDYDGDGIAELRHVCAAGDLTSKHILVNDYADFVRYFDVVIERRPHQWEGTSITDDLIEIQRVKTVCLRNMMDNTYQVIIPTKTINVDKLKDGNADAFMDPEPGRPAWLTGVDKVSDAVQYDVTPYIGDKAMAAIEYWDRQISDRTGIDDTSAGMPDNALQNVTAKATAVMEQKGIAQTEMMVRTIANCLKPVFGALLQLSIQNQDKARMIRLRGKDVRIDPRSWNATMDVRINTGLGAGSRERDMMVMGQIMQVQQTLEQLFGADSPILKPENIYNAVESMVHAAGIKSVGKYFTKPSPESIQAYKDAKAQQKSPEQQKVDAQIQLLGEQSKANTAKETAQMQADTITTNAKRDADLMIKEAEAKKNQADEYVKNLLEKHKIDSSERIANAQIASNERIAMDRTKQDYLKHEAVHISKSITGLQDAEAEIENLKNTQSATPQKSTPTSRPTAQSTKPKTLKATIIRDPKTGDMSSIEIN